MLTKASGGGGIVLAGKGGEGTELGAAGEESGEGSRNVERSDGKFEGRISVDGGRDVGGCCKMSQAEYSGGGGIRDRDSSWKKSSAVGCDRLRW
jgi:hypothetical protein